MRTLLVDNYDSYTFNLFQLLGEVNGTNPVVIVNDDPSLVTLRLGSFDNIVISPGAGRPQNSRDVGYVIELLRRTTLPVLGICLGHQVIAYEAGTIVGFAPQPRHGHLTKVRHVDEELFGGLSQEFVVVRYHSLRVEEPVPAKLIPTAWAEDGVIMALRHRDLPRWGVQSHPESIVCRYGRELLANFRDLSIDATAKSEAEPVAVAGNTAAAHRIFFVASLAAGKLAPRFGWHILEIGSVISGLGFVATLVVALTGEDHLSVGALIPSLIVVGIGIGIGNGLLLPQLLNTVLSRIGPNEVGMASGVLSTGQQTGGALGVGVIGVLFFNALGGQAT